MKDARIHHYVRGYSGHWRKNAEGKFEWHCRKVAKYILRGKVTRRQRFTGQRIEVSYSREVLFPSALAFAKRNNLPEPPAPEVVLAAEV